MIPFSIFIFCIVSLFFLSKRVTNDLFFLTFSFVKKRNLSLYLVCLLYFPGTVIHEVSHFVTAAALLLKVRTISVIPEISHDYVKLGSVQYERADYIRGLLVGIAPFFVGIFIFYVFASENILSSPNLLIKFLAIYFIFVLSSTMFSSKKDLADLIFVLPLVLFLPVLIYIFKIDISPILYNQTLQESLMEFLRRINYYLLISVLINVAILCIVKLLHPKHRHV